MAFISKNEVLPFKRGIIAAGFFSIFQCSPSAFAASVIVNLSPSALGQISPSQVIIPASNAPYLSVQGDAREDPFPSRIVIEFPLAGIAGSGQVISANFSATGFGGVIGSTQLKMSLFGYAGTGSVSLETGIDPLSGASIGPVLAGPYTINSFTAPNLTNINVTLFIQALIDLGATHAGFMFRDVDTPNNTVTRVQFIVVQDVPAWGGDIPPSLSLTVVPEPSTSLLSIAAAALLLRRRRC